MNIFHSTMNDIAAIFTVLVGTGVGAQLATSPVNHFVPGYSGQGVRFNSKDDYLQYQESDGSIVNWPAATGSVEWMMKPRFADSNTEKLTFFQRRAWLAPGMLEIGKHNASNGNTFRVITIDASGLRTDHEIDQAVWAAALEQGVWAKVRLSWDWNAAPGVQCLTFTVNDVALPWGKVSQGATIVPPLTGPQSYMPAAVGEYFYLGSRGPGSPYRANMDADELILSD